MSTSIPPRVRVYGVSLRVRILLWGFLGPLGLALMALPILAHHVRKVDGYDYLLAVLGLLLLCWLRWMISRVRLELSPEGIRACDPGFTVETSWTNLAEVRLGKDWSDGGTGFITREPMVGAGADRRAAGGGYSPRGVAIYGPEVCRLIVERRFIPLKPYTWHMTHGDFVDEVERHAPQLRLREALRAADWL